MKLDNQLFHYFESNLLDSALILGKKILKNDPKNLNALLIYSLTLAKKENYDEAIKNLKKLCELNPTNIDYRINLAISQKKNNQFNEAIKSFKKISDYEFNDKILVEISTCFAELRLFTDAENFLLKAIKQNKLNNIAWCNLGNVKIETYQDREAIKFLIKSLRIDNSYPVCWTNLGNAFNHIGKHNWSLNCHHKSLKLFPNSAATWSNAGSTLIDLKNYELALDYFENALKINNNFADALINKSYLKSILGKFKEAKEINLQALRINKDSVQINYNLAHIYLAEMNFLEGWKQYEWRWKTREFNSAPITTSKPIWNGKDFAVRLYVWAEQGLGDQILYASMFHQLRSSVQTLIVGVDQKLLILFRRSFPNIEFLDKNFIVSEENYDVHIPIGSLGQFFRRDKKDFETVQYPYLTVCNEKYQSLKKKLVQPSLKLVGLSWLSKNEKIGSFKSIQLSELLPILTVSNTKFIDLQYTDTVSERGQLRKEYGIDIEKINSIDNFNDIDGLAALIMCCDMVITTSNTTAHLAGAIGKKVILLLPFSKGRFWYWHHENKQSLWYPSVTVNEQLKMDDWLEVIQVVANNISLEQK